MKVLIVEDEKKLAFRVKQKLRQEGYIVELSFDGEDARNLILMNHESFDIILLDEMLPHIQGSEICQEMRKLDISTPVLMITAKDLEGDIISGFYAGADDYLTKPFSLAILSVRVQALLRRPKQLITAEKEIQIGPFNLNLKTRKVHYNQQEVNLTLKEYNVLEYLIKHPNVVVEREELLEKMWDSNFSSFSNVVDVQITRIRKKLKKISDVPVVETIRGVGFKLKAQTP